ncbi:MAG: D-alanyl-D-alanine carboxypeptidase, partial [Acutalibacteraceae bacterium]
MVGKRMAAAIGCLLIALSSWASAGSIDPIEVSASSAVLIEAESGRILFEKNARTPRPMASTTKIMTALLAAEALDPERVITVRDEAVRVEGTALGLR